MSIFNLTEQEYLNKSLALQALIKMGMPDKEAEQQVLQTYYMVNGLSLI